MIYRGINIIRKGGLGVLPQEKFGQSDCRIVKIRAKFRRFTLKHFRHQKQKQSIFFLRTWKQSIFFPRKAKQTIFFQ